MAGTTCIYSIPTYSNLIPHSAHNVTADSEVCHPCCVFKLYGEVDSVKSTTTNI